MTISRRMILRTGVSVGAALALPTIGGCAWLKGSDDQTRSGPQGGTRLADGVHRIQLGDTRITALSDGIAEFPSLEGFVRNASVEQVRQALSDAGLPTDRITIPFTAFLVETRGKRILMDAGNGKFGAPTAGRLVERLRATGIVPETIDTVLVSHFHGDHINGLRDKDGSLTYRNAEIVVPAPEWDFWMDDARMAAAPDAMKGAFQTARRVFGPIAGEVRKILPGADAVPGVRAIAAHGHTPGHTLYSIDTGDRTWTFLADLTNIAPLFMRNPDWAVSFDMDAEGARRTRRSVLDRAINEDWLVSGYHLPFPAIGRVSRRDHGYAFTPIA